MGCEAPNGCPDDDGSTADQRTCAEQHSGRDGGTGGDVDNRATDALPAPAPIQVVVVDRVGVAVFVVVGVASEMGSTERKRPRAGT